jgi:hypothetical protein
VLVGEILDELSNTCPELIREVWSRGTNERVDVVEGRLSHVGQPNRGALAANWWPKQCQAL